MSQTEVSYSVYNIFGKGTTQSEENLFSLLFSTCLWLSTQVTVRMESSVLIFFPFLILFPGGKSRKDMSLKETTKCLVIHKYHVVNAKASQNWQ